MALSTLQEEFIEKSIAHLIDFSANYETFKLEIEELKQALDPTLTVDSSNAYFQLRLCILNPTAYFNLLEILNEHPITEAEVKLHIINLISSQLEKNALQLEMPFTEELWDKKQTILDLIFFKNYDKEFKSFPIAADPGDHPLQLCNPSDSIYSQKIRIEDDDENPEIEYSDTDDPSRSAYVDITVECGSKTICTTIFLKRLRSYFYDDQEEQEYLENLKLDAQYEAENYTSRKVIKYWAEKFSDTNLKYKVTLPKKVITHQFYFNQVENGLIDYQLLLNLNGKQEKILIDPAIISLLKHDVFDIYTAINLSAAAHRLVDHPVYNGLLKAKKIRMSQVEYVIDSRSKFLICPPIANLIALNKLTLTDAKKLPIELQAVFNNSLYQAYFLRDNFDWKYFFILKPSECELLKNQLIGKLVVNDILDVCELSSITPKVIEKLKIPDIYYLVEKKHLTIYDLLNKGTFEVNFYLNNPKFISWIKSGIIQFDEINIYRPFTSYVTLYSDRLYQIFNEKPFTIDKTVDTIDALLEELPFAAETSKTSVTKLTDNILENLIAMLKDNLQHKLSSANNCHEEYQELISIITRAEAENASSRVILDALIAFAVAFRKKLSVTNYLKDDIKEKRKNCFDNDFLFISRKKFKPDNTTPENNFGSFCERLIKLSDLKNTGKSYGPSMFR